MGIHMDRRIDRWLNRQTDAQAEGKID